MRMSKRLRMRVRRWSSDGVCRDCTGEDAGAYIFGEGLMSAALSLRYVMLSGLPPFG